MNARKAELERRIERIRLIYKGEPEILRTYLYLTDELSDLLANSDLDFSFLSSVRN